MLFISGKKNDGRKILARQSPEDLKAVHTGHLHIEKNYIRRELEDLLDSRRAVSAFANDFDIFVLLQPELYSASCQRLIIHNHRAHVASSTFWVTFRRGNSMIA